MTGTGTPSAGQADGSGLVTVRVPVTLEHGGLTLLVHLGPDGQLGGLQLAPPEAAQPTRPWQPPAYADPARLTEEALTVGAGPLAVPAVLSLPKEAGPHPAVLLLAGSGPADRDETTGRNKPLKDLAWGLASRGVVVLRFDKITQAHPETATPAFTLTDEYVPQASAAVRLLRGHPAVDPARVYLAGHSLGGTAAPRVAAAGPGVTGLILLAAGAQPLAESIARQFRHLASVDPDAGPAAAHTLGTITRQAERAASPDLSPDTLPAELPFGIPAPYWLDLRGYDPAAAAAALDVPVLILQGARDYQATVADDLSRWQAALAGRPDVTVRVYDADNHLFFAGSGPSSPAEYEPEQHVDSAVVTDIADWLAAAPA